MAYVSDFNAQNAPNRLFAYNLTCPQDEFYFGSSPLSLTPMASCEGSVCDEDDEGDTMLYSQGVLDQMKKDEEVKYAAKCLREFKEEAVEYSVTVLKSIERVDDKNPAYLAEWIMNAAALLVEADSEGTDDEEAPKRPITTRLSLMTANRDVSLSSAAASLQLELDKRRHFVPDDAESQKTMVYFTVKVRIQMLEKNRETLRQ